MAYLSHFGTGADFQELVHLGFQFLLETVEGLFSGQPGLVGEDTLHCVEYFPISLTEFSSLSFRVMGLSMGTSGGVWLRESSSSKQTNLSVN